MSEDIQSALQSGQIHFTGLGSGTDFDSIIAGTVKIESQRIARLELWRKSWTDKVAKFQELNTSMLSLKSSLEGMDRLGEFLVKNSTSTDDSILTVTAGPEALEGTHSLKVYQRAQTHILTGNTISANKDAAIDSGSARTFQYTYDGTQRTLAVPQGTSLQGLVDTINGDAENPGVKASLLKVSDTEYRLQLRGMDLGAAKTVSVGAATDLPGYTSASFTTTQAAQDARIQVDGYPSAAYNPADPTTYISRSSNTLTDVIDGLTINLKSAEPGTLVEIATETDKESVKEQVRSFVAKMNEVRQIITDMTKVDTTNQTGSILTGNYGVEIISQKLKTITASAGLGFGSDNAGNPTPYAYSVLSQVGITTDHEGGSPTKGQLLIDEDKLDAALDADPQAVAELFSAYFDGDTDSGAFKFSSAIAGQTQAGIYDVQYNLGAGTASIGGYPAKISGQYITALEGPARGLALQVNTAMNGPQSGTVRVRLGKSGELIEELKQLTSSTSGPLHVLEENYKDITDSIDKKIEYEQKRISRLEKDLRSRFARTESMLGYYQGMMTSLQNSANQLAQS